MRTLLLITTLFLVTSCTSVSQAEPMKQFRPRQPKVEIFVTSWCRYCRALESFLKGHNVAFTKYDIEKDPKARERHSDLGGGGVPVVLINSKEITHGFQPDYLFEKLRIH